MRRLRTPFACGFVAVSLSTIATLSLCACDAQPTIAREAPSLPPISTTLAVGPPLWFEQPPNGVDLAVWIKTEAAAARAKGERTVVYLGAPWCEPCRNFHAAVDARQLDTRLPRTRFLQFDADRHAKLLAEIGYTSTYIPLFAVPGDDGRGAGKQIAGSIKGPGAADEIAPRLLALLGGRGE